MVATARVNIIIKESWIYTFPGVATTFTVPGIKVFGNWIRDHLDLRLNLR